MKRPRKDEAQADAERRKQHRLDLIEERVLRLRYGSVPPDDAPLGRKSEDPVVLADLERLERVLVARLRGAPQKARPAARKARTKRS